MFHCPKCNSENVRRSRTRSRWERWRKEITSKLPYRCRACNWRLWLRAGIIPDSDGRERRRRAADPPNLRGTLLARNDKRPTIDLKKLNTFHSSSDREDA